MPTRLANIGYMAIGKETTPGTAVTPTVYVPLYDSSMAVNTNVDKEEAIVGQKSKYFDAYRGQRSHSGVVTVLAEPNTAGHLLNMILKKGSDSGSPSVYTHPFTLDNTTDPKSYTVDIAKGQTVERYAGVQIEQIDLVFNKNKMEFKLKMSALSSFIGMEVAATPTGSNPYTIVLKTNQDSNPTSQLVASDIMTAQVAAGGATTNFTVASVVDATSLTTTTNVTSLAAGDMIFLRPATPSFVLRAPFMWAKTVIGFGATASAAGTAATQALQTRCEVGTKWTLTHEFEKATGSERSGAFDPAALVRKQGMIEFTVKLFFDTLDDYMRFKSVTKRAAVIHHYSEDTTFDMKLTLNNLRADSAPIPVKFDEILYAEFKYITTYDSGDGQSFDISLINALSTM